MNLIRICKALSLTPLGFVTAFSANQVLADTYQVTVTNGTRGQTFTPRLAVVHNSGNLFSVGQPALGEIATIAESGNVAPAMTLLQSVPDLVTDIEVGGGLLAPGGSQEVMVEGQPGQLLSILAMLIPTNDAFVAVNAVALPASGSMTVTARAYDAGSEPNDELCANIPGPRCGGEGDSPGVNGEGYVHIHGGIHGIGDLAAADYDWRNPVAFITITRMP